MLSQSTWQWLGGADNVTATLVSLGLIIVTIRSGLRHTILRRRRIRQNLDSLGIGMNSEYAAYVLGAPVFGRLAKPETGGDGTLTWVSAHAYVQMCFARGAAMQIAITVTDPLLRYDITKLTRRTLRGRLGKSVRTEHHPEGVRAYLGARRVGCSITYWGGNPGGYLHYTVSYNDASCLGTFPPVLLRGDFLSASSGLLGRSGEQEPEDSLIEQMQSQLVPNTIIVTGSTKCLRQRDLGVDQDDVRLLVRPRTWAEAGQGWCAAALESVRRSYGARAQAS